MRAAEADDDALRRAQQPRFSRMARHAQRVRLRHLEIGEDLRALPFRLVEHAVDLDLSERTGGRKERGRAKQPWRALHNEERTDPTRCYRQATFAHVRAQSNASCLR